MGTGIPVMFKSLNVFIEEMIMAYNIEKNETDGQIIASSFYSCRATMTCTFDFELTPHSLSDVALSDEDIDIKHRMRIGKRINAMRRL